MSWESSSKLKNSWDSLIRRAEHLAAKSDATKELLNFYAELLRAQKEIYEFLRTRKGWLPSGMLEEDLPVVRVVLPGLLRTVEANGPAALVEEARRVDAEVIYWSTLHAPAGEQRIGPTATYLLSKRPCRVIIETDNRPVQAPGPAPAREAMPA